MYYKQYEESKPGKEPILFVSESYMPTETKQEIEAFRKVLEEGNGKDHPWVHKLSRQSTRAGGSPCLGPNSPRLMELPEVAPKDLKQYKSDAEESIVQRYICNEMTRNDRKFDVWMFWFVASLDPLIVRPGGKRRVQRDVHPGHDLPPDLPHGTRRRNEIDLFGR